MVFKIVKKKFSHAQNLTKRKAKMTKRNFCKQKCSNLKKSQNCFKEARFKAKHSPKMYWFYMMVKFK